MDKNNISINLRIEKFKQGLVDFVNNSELPISIVYLVWDGLSKELEKSYYAALNAESIQNSEERTEHIGSEEEDVNSQEITK